MLSKEQIKELNEDYFKHTKLKKDLEWAGCNYYKNQGTTPTTPKGTAQSLQCCTGCIYYDYCDMQQETPIWVITKEKEQELKEKFEKLRVEIEGER